MPALAGALRRGSESAAASVRCMLDAAPHRGRALDVRCLGDMALGVSDVGEGRQSSIVADGRTITAFVGRLDNESELEADLTRRGASRPERSPAGMVAALFDVYGDAAPARLRGEFAAAIGDGRELRCFRDQLGFRALFHRHDASGFAFASEAKQVAAGSGVPVRVDAAVVEQIFFGGLLDETATPLAGVHRLPKATTLTASVDAWTRSRYWHPEELLETGRWQPAEVQERFDRLMAQAAARMVTASTVVSLSGGIDSPAVAAYAAPPFRALTGRALPAICRLYPDHPSVDEREYVELVAEALDLDLHTYVHRSRHLEDVEKWMRLLDGPVPFWSGSDVGANLRAARELGADTVLTGEVAEFVMDAGEHLDGYLLARGRLSALGRRARARRAHGQPWLLAARRTLMPFVPRRLALAMHRQRPRRIPAWLDRRFVDDAPGHLSQRVSGRWRWNQLRAFDGAGLSVEGEEIRQDVLGVRVRMPWADVDLWEFFLSLPAEVKYPGIPHKALVRHLLRGRVPDAILDRTDKTVFNDAVLADVDYAAMRAWLIDSGIELPGVDYRRLAAELHDETLDVPGYVWARDLCVAHAWLAGWSSSTDEQPLLPVGASGS